MFMATFVMINLSDASGISASGTIMTSGQVVKNRFCQKWKSIPSINDRQHNKCTNIAEIISLKIKINDTCIITMPVIHKYST